MIQSPSPVELMDRLRRKPPLDFDELIGPAATVARILGTRARKAKRDPDAGTFAHLIYGPPGSGKTMLANILAHQLAGEWLAVEEVAAIDVTVEVVRAWEQSARFGNLFSDWNVKVIHELDLMPPVAQNRLLQYLDKLPPRSAVVATSNLQLHLIQDRLQSRAQAWQVLGPSEEEIRDYLAARWPLSAHEARSIAFGCGGNLRQALLDAQSALDARELLAA